MDNMDNTERLEAILEAAPELREAIKAQRGITHSLITDMLVLSRCDAPVSGMEIKSRLTGILDLPSNPSPKEVANAVFQEIAKVYPQLCVEGAGGEPFLEPTSYPIDDSFAIAA